MLCAITTHAGASGKSCYAVLAQNRHNGAGSENRTHTFCLEDRCRNRLTIPAIGYLNGAFCAVTHYPATAIGELLYFLILQLEGTRLDG